jgi:hypothetical protein
VPLRVLRGENILNIFIFQAISPSIQTLSIVWYLLGIKEKDKKGAEKT